MAKVNASFTEHKVKPPCVTAVIVTYGDRAELCLKVVTAAMENGVKNVIIVDNGSPQDNAKKLDEFAASTLGVICLRQSENLGSAGGVAKGLEQALQLQTDDIWILDDDNRPAAGCLEALLTTRAALSTAFQGIVLYCYRGTTRKDDQRAVINGTVKHYRNNAFLAFTFWARLARLFQTSSRNKDICFPVVRARFGPYGGMFATRDIFETLGPPRSDFFLYADDHEYSARMEHQSLHQFLVFAAKIDDLDQTFADGLGMFDPENSALRVYFQVRNHTYLGMNNIQCRSCYEFNKAVFLLHQLFKARRSVVRRPRLVMQRVALIFSAISDGEAGRLGPREDLF